MICKSLFCSLSNWVLKLTKIFLNFILERSMSKIVQTKNKSHHWIINEYFLLILPQDKQSLSTTSNMDRQLLHQKSCQKFSVMKTKNGVSRKIVCFAILIHIFSWKQEKHQWWLCFHYWDFLTNFWRNNGQSIFDVCRKTLL